MHADFDTNPSLVTVRNYIKLLVQNFLGKEKSDLIFEHKTSRNFFKHNSLLNETQVDTIARIICFGCTGAPDAAYFWGLKDHMMNDDMFNIKDSIDWIYNDFNTKKIHFSELDCGIHILPNMQSKFALHIDPFYSRFQTVGNNVHRAGWKHIVQCMRSANDLYKTQNYVNTEKPIMIDTFSDRTFLWGESTFLAAGLLPYSSPWIGFIHHTFDESHSTYNCVTMMSKKSFADSIPYCKGLIVMSETLKHQVESYMDAYGFPLD